MFLSCILGEAIEQQDNRSCLQDCLACQHKLEVEVGIVLHSCFRETIIERAVLAAVRADDIGKVLFIMSKTELWKLLPHEDSVSEPTRLAQVREACFRQCLVALLSRENRIEHNMSLIEKLTDGWESLYGPATPQSENWYRISSFEYSNASEATILNVCAVLERVAKPGNKCPIAKTLLAQKVTTVGSSYIKLIGDHVKAWGIDKTCAADLTTACGIAAELANPSQDVILDRMLPEDELYVKYMSLHGLQHTIEAKASDTFKKQE